MAVIFDFFFVMVVAIAILIIVPINPIKGEDSEPSPEQHYTYTRCPTCGDRARIYGDTWECEFCGDFGRICYK